MVNSVPALFLCCVLLFSVSAAPSSATTDYARQTGLACAACHVDAVGGGLLTQEGRRFLDDMKTRGLHRPLSNTQKVIRFVVGYIHLFFAIAWFGTILYVHVLLKPAYAAKGLPKGELLLGWVSIIVLGSTGILLSISRIPTWHALLSTRFGILLIIKVLLFLVMATTAALVTFVIGPKLKRKWKIKWQEEISRGKQDLTSEELRAFDGKEGKPAYLAYEGIIYDVTASGLWKEGIHARKHSAGQNLTPALKTAPHGAEKVLSQPVVGKLLAPGKTPLQPLPERIFYVFAYVNLFLVFLIIFVISLWRWG